MGNVYKTLKLTDVNTPKLEIYEDGVLINDFKYCSFIKQMKGFEFYEGYDLNGIEGFTLTTKNANTAQKVFTQSESGMMNNFQLTITEPEFIISKKSDIINYGTSGDDMFQDVFDVNEGLPIGNAPDSFDGIKVYLPTKALRDEYAKRWDSEGYNTAYGLQSSEIIFLDKPEPSTGDPEDMRATTNAIQVTFYNNQECEE